MLGSENRTRMGRIHKFGIPDDSRKLHRREFTFPEQMVDGLGEIDDTFGGIIGDPLEEFDVELVLRVIDDEFFVQGDG